MQISISHAPPSASNVSGFNVDRPATDRPDDTSFTDTQLRQTAVPGGALKRQLVRQTPSVASSASASSIGTFQSLNPLRRACSAMRAHATTSLPATTLRSLDAEYSAVI